MSKSRKSCILLTLALLVFCAHTGRSAGNVQPKENLKPLLVGKTAGEAGGKLAYKVNAGQSGNYDIILWQCAAKKKDGSLQTYKITINGLEKVVSAGKAGWSFLSLPSVSLREGANLITIASDLPQIPAVEFVRVQNPANGKSQAMTSTAYDEYVADIKRDIRRNVLGTGDIATPETDSLISATIDPDLDQVPYSFNYVEIPWFGYSFYTTVYLKQGEPFHCVSEAQGGQRHFIEIFSADLPDSYSWVSVSSNGTIDYSIKSVPYTGVYFVRVRTHKNGSIGLCNLNINDEAFYEEMPMCTMGVRSNFCFKTDKYNVLTVSNESDPFLSINKGNDFNGVVWAYNDDYVGDGDFDWGLNARINRTFAPETNTSRILVFSASSYAPIGSCELYIGCKNYTSNIAFANLKDDDAIQATPVNSAYNCFSWAGGITNDKSQESPGLPLSSFDRFYAKERYPGCARYTRKGATEENSVIDLWRKYTFTGNTAQEIITHASIRRNSDGNHHGYDWESKLGTKERIFHPRYALEGDDYGKVLYHYRLSDDSPKNPITLDMALAENKAVMDNVALSGHQELFLRSRISEIEDDVLSKFNDLYTAWDNVWNNTIHSNLEVIKKDGDSYGNLMKYCLNNEAVRYLVFDKLNRGITSSIPLFEELYVARVENNRKRLESIHLSNDTEMYDAEGRQIIRTTLVNLKRLLCYLIPYSDQQEVHMENPHSFAGNIIENEIKIQHAGEGVCLSLSLPEASGLTVDILDHKGEFSRRIIHNYQMSAGNYAFNIHLQKGKLMLVRININGNIVVRKVLL